MFRPASCGAGQGTLSLRIIRHRVARTVSTSYVLSAGEWDGDRQKVVCPDGSLPGRKRELSVIESKIKKDRLRIFKSLERFEARGNYSSQEVADHFRRQREGQLFCAYIERKVSKLNKEERFGTAHTYKFAAVSFLHFLGNKDIRMEKIDPLLIKDYERYLQEKGNSRNTISSYMRLLRAAYNELQKETGFPERKSKQNPFLGVFTGNAKTQKRAIEVVEVSRLMDAASSTTPLHVRGEASRDLFLFSLFAQGMSFSDMANLKKENIEGGTLQYNRKKTGQTITVKVEEPMKAIIDRYADPASGYIFPILRKVEHGDKLAQWKAANTALAAYNTNLKELSLMVGITKHVTSYVSRHTWASLASLVGVPIATISRGMGHQSEKTTRIYIANYGYSDVEEANKKILSRLTEKDS